MKNVPKVLRCMFVLAFFLGLMWEDMRGQKPDSTLQNAISAAAINNDEIHLRGKRPMLNTKKVSGAQRLNPLLYISSGLLYVYQNVFSEQIQADCTYELSCSSYTKRSIERHGFFVGLMMGLDQLSACYAGLKAQYPEYKISSKDLIDNSIEE